MTMGKRNWIVIALAAVALSISVWWYWLRPVNALITLDPAARYQQFRDWEATAWALSDDPAVFRSFRDELFRLAADDLGLTRVRLEIRSGAEADRDYYSEMLAGRLAGDEWRSKRYATVNDNDDPNVIGWTGFHFTELDRNLETLVQPLREYFARRDLKLNVNLCYVAFTGQIQDGGRYAHGDIHEYGEFIEAVWRHLDDKFGFVPDSLELVLEPDNTRQWNGALMGRAIVEVASRLRRAGFAVPAFIAPSTTSMGRAVTFFDDMMAVPGVQGLLTELSYHRYRGVSRSNLAAIAERAKRFGVGTSMLEWIGADYSTLADDLKRGWNSSWAQYALAGSGNDDGSKYYLVDASDPSRPRIWPGSRTVLLRQYSRYIRPGAVRIDAETSDGRMEPVAFQSADGTVVVVVKGSRRGDMTLTRLPRGIYGVTYALEGDAGGVLPDVTVGTEGTLTASLPGAGVITVAGRKERLRP